MNQSDWINLALAVGSLVLGGVGWVIRHYITTTDDEIKLLRERTHKLGNYCHHLLWKVDLDPEELDKRLEEYDPDSKPPRRRTDLGDRKRPPTGHG